MNFPINLIGELVAIRLDNAGLSESRVLLPDWRRCLSGKVLATGSEVREVFIDDRVSFGAAVGMDSLLSGQEIRIMKEKDIDFIYEDWTGVPICKTCQNYVESSEEYCTACLDGL